MAQLVARAVRDCEVAGSSPVTPTNHKHDECFFLWYNHFMKQVEKITLAELRKMSEKMFGNMVKADVDVAKGIVVLDAELHADIEQYMLDNGSLQNDLWGINLYPEQFGSPDFIEFDSMINIRPRQNNRSRYVEDPAIRQKIVEIIDKVVDGN